MAVGESRYEDAALEAEQVVRDHNITALPVDPFVLAEAVSIEVQPKPSIAAGVSGMLCKAGDNFGILYATHIPNEGLQQFSVR